MKTVVFFQQNNKGDSTAVLPAYNFMSTFLTERQYNTSIVIYIVFFHSTPKDAGLLMQIGEVVLTASLPH